MKYEYTELTIDVNDGEANTLMNRFGGEGWYVVGTIPKSKKLTVVLFEREIEETTDQLVTLNFVGPNWDRWSKTLSEQMLSTQRRKAVEEMEGESPIKTASEWERWINHVEKAAAEAPAAYTDHTTLWTCGNPECTIGGFSSLQDKDAEFDCSERGCPECGVKSQTPIINVVYKLEGKIVTMTSFTIKKKGFGPEVYWYCGNGSCSNRSGIFSSRSDGQSRSAEGCPVCYKTSTWRFR